MICSKRLEISSLMKISVVACKPHHSSPGLPGCVAWRLWRDAYRKHSVHDSRGRPPTRYFTWLHDLYDFIVSMQLWPCIITWTWQRTGHTWNKILTDHLCHVCMQCWSQPCVFEYLVMMKLVQCLQCHIIHLVAVRVSWYSWKWSCRYSWVILLD